MARAQSKYAASFADGMQDLVGAAVDDEVAVICGTHAADAQSAGGALTWVPLAKLQPSPDQPRVADEDIDELAAQIAADGILQPPQVRRTGDTLTIVFGHRRVAALRRLAAQGLDRPIPAADGWPRETFLRLAAVPEDSDVAVRIVEIDDLTALKRTVSENLARLDLAAFEQVVAVGRLKRALTANGDDASLRSGLVPALGLAKHKVERPHYVAERLVPQILVAAGVLAEGETDLRAASPELQRLSIDALRRVVDALGVDAQARALRLELARLRPKQLARAEEPPRAYGLRIVVRGDLSALAPKKAAGYAVELGEALARLLDVAASALTAEQTAQLAALAPRLQFAGVPGAKRPR